MNQQTVRIYPNVKLGEGVKIEDWVIIGKPPKGVEAGELETVIEDGAYIRSHSVIYAGSRIGPNFQTGHRCVLGPGLEIGQNSSVGTDSIVLGYTKFFDRVRIHGYCSIGLFTLIREGAWIGPHCILDSTPEQPIIVEPRAILGSELYVKPGMRIGKRSLVGAGVFVDKDISPERLTAGTPARTLRRITSLTCPYELIDSPYTKEEDEVVKTSLSSLEQKEDDDLLWTQNTWRHELWNRLQDYNFRM